MQNKGEKKVRRDFKSVASTLIVAFAVVSFWRGVWGLMDLYLYPKNHLLSFSISIVLGVVILYLTKNLIRKLI